MASTHTNLQATNSEGGLVTVQQTATDSPLLPAANLQQLAAIDPKLVDWVVEQTQKEAEFRRGEVHRTNNFVFVERIAGICAAVILALTGLGVVVYLAMNGHDWVAGVIGGGALVGLVSAVLSRKKDHSQSATVQVLSGSTRGRSDD